MSDRAVPPGAEALEWIDNHCHLDPDGDVERVISESAAAGVTELVCVGVDVGSSRSCLRLAAAHRNVWATAGVHPHEASGGTDGLEDLLAAGDARFAGPVAVGECGLDHHYDHSPRDAQRSVFAQQIALANEHDLPLVIHTREAWEETFVVLDGEGVPRRTVFHCFTGGPDEARECVARGAMLSISGIVTFGSAQDVRDAVRETPLERLMVETDSPYLAPVPNRGKPNRPAWVGIVGAAVADAKELRPAEVAAATTANARAFYALGDRTG